MADLEMNGNIRSNRLLTGLFGVYCLLFAGVWLFEVIRAGTIGVADLSARDSVLVMALWMVPLLILSVTCLFGFSVLRRTTTGRPFVLANAHGLKWIGFGVVISGAIESILQAGMDNIIPEIVAWGDKNNFLLMAYMAIGGLLLIMGQVMKQAAAMKEDHDHFL